jgi:acyl-CoA reductase-like NAD-dependent aldehyde dehydrogenase
MEVAYQIGSSHENGQGDDVLVDSSPSDVRRVIANFRLMTRQQTERAIEAAIGAFPEWRAKSALSRGAVLLKAAELVRARRDEYARSIADENGKTLMEATVEVEKSADFFEFYGASARLPTGGIIADSRPGTRAMAMIEPLGVIALITPWNDPMLTPARKLGPALISGNTVLLKPARETPLAASYLVEALVAAGMPAGVVNTVLTDHAVFDEVILAHPELAAVSFTGSTAVGLGLSRKLAGRAVRLQTEMGGKNASWVLPDADLSLAVTTLMAAGLGQAGQRCTATSRIVVDSQIAAEFTSRLLQSVAQLKVGPSLERDTQMGPVVSRKQQSEILAHIDQARSSGARIATGGGVPEKESLTHGCFVQPTVVTHVSRTMPLWREEVFGPVLAIHEVNSWDEGLAAVNDSAYGLSASIFTNSLRSAQLFLDAANAGQVAVNLPTSGWDVHQPFGGFKDSGSAFKEQGLEGLRFYTRTKMTATRFSW